MYFYMKDGLSLQYIVTMAYRGAYNTTVPEFFLKERMCVGCPPYIIMGYVFRSNFLLFTFPMQITSLFVKFDEHSVFETFSYESVDLVSGHDNEEQLQGSGGKRLITAPATVPCSTITHHNV